TTTTTARKGPAAGTGHEGYGRIGAVRRRSGNSATLLTLGLTATAPAVSSQESLCSALSVDPFLMERVNPVVIAGGGQVVDNRNRSSELSRTESNQSFFAFGRPSVESRGSSQLSSTSSSREGAGTRATMWPTAFPEASSLTPPPPPHAGRRRPSHGSSDSE